MMNRRDFLIRSALLAAGGMVAATLPAWAQQALQTKELSFDSELYRRFRAPTSTDRPFVRWWWNGNRIEAAELVRELRLLHAAGIGGVEINPVKFPEEADPVGKPVLPWLSEAWIDMLSVAFAEAKRLGMTCDLIIGSGWPFGGEYLEGEELGQVAVIAVKKLKGPMRFECTPAELYKESDPAVNNPYEGRTFELLSLSLVPDPVSRPEQVVNLNSQLGRDAIVVDVPSGEHALYALVKITAFMKVINGVPGADGPVVNHFNAAAVRNYLDRMSRTIEARTGPLRDHIRAFFCDGLELEGANWCADMAAEFARRRGYDLMPMLPFTMYKTGSMGNVTDWNYGARLEGAFADRIQRVRYDYCLTQAELLIERFFIPVSEWAHRVGVLSRLECYGRGAFPLNSSFYADIPEGESWTSNWLRHRPGAEMPNDDYRRGRAYTMINKYVSSAAHLKGRRTVSAEDMTNTYDVFNMSLEFLKLGSDMSIISGITHSVFHGFNYSPPEAPFPGWIRYGAYYSEQNNWWPYFRHLTDYKARLSAVLQQADMYADIALLTPTADMWSEMGFQTEPFPSEAFRPELQLLWEAIHKHGSACDYISDEVLMEATVGRDGRLCYGQRSYTTIFLTGIERVHPAEMERLLEFVERGGRVFCIGKEPTRSLGWGNGWQQRDERVGKLLEQLHTLSRYVRLTPPADGDYMAWYAEVQRTHVIRPYLKINEPNLYVMQNRYRTTDGQELLFLTNSHDTKPYRGRISFSNDFTDGRHPWVWNPVDGNCYRLHLSPFGAMEVDLAPAESMLFVFNKLKEGPQWRPLAAEGPALQELTGWDVELRHSREGWTRTLAMDRLTDLKDTEYINFTGEVVYRKRFTATNPAALQVLNLGRVEGVSELLLNGEPLGVTWYGRRLYDVAGRFRVGENTLEVKVVTTMGNYMRTLTGNATAQKWTTGRKIQRDQSMGLIGPVTLYTQPDSKRSFY